MLAHLADVSIRSLVLALIAATGLWILRRKRPAALTHAIWAAVMCSMLALFVFGSSLPRLPLRILESPVTLMRAAEVPSIDSPPLPGEPLSAQVQTRTALTQAIDWNDAFLATYFLIALALLARFMFGILLARKLLAQSISTGIFRESNLISVPVTIGWLRPRIVLPIDWHNWPTAKLDAVLTHEQAHVRRRDGLVAALAQVNRCIFWFHPLAWFLERRLALLAEQACDESCIAVLGDLNHYANLLLEMASLTHGPDKRLRGHALTMAASSHIRQRIDALLAEGRMFSTGLTCQARWAIVVCGLAFAVTAGVVDLARAQSAPSAARITTSRPKFEVASIRPCNPNESTGSARSGSGGGASPLPPGRLTINCESVDALIWYAYDLYANGPRLLGNDPRAHLLPPIEGAPAWARSERYRIDAKPEGQASVDVMRGPMLQTLLEDRFRLKVHREAHEVAGYALTIAKGGPKLTPFPEGGCWHIGEQPDPNRPLCGMNKPEAARRGRGSGALLLWDVPGLDATGIAKMLQRYLNHPVVDRTGLTGLFAVRMEFAWDDSITPFITRECSPDCGPVTAPDPGGPPPIFTALQQQLGLKLEPTKESADTLVIDHIERPTEN